MNGLMRVTGAWTGLLTDWLDRESLAAPRLRAQLARFALDDAVPLPVWRDALAQAAALRPGELALGLQIGAGVQPRHLGVLGYLVAPQTTVEAQSTALRHEADYTLERFEMQLFDKTGRLVALLEGQQLRHFPDTRELEIDTVRITFTAPDGRVTHITARQAAASDDGVTARLEGDARVESQGLAGAPPVLIEGQRLLAGLAGLAGMVVAALALAVAPLRLGVAGYLAPLVGLTACYALFQTANNTAVMGELRPDRRGVVSGVLALSRNLGLGDLVRMGPQRSDHRPDIGTALSTTPPPRLPRL